MSYDGDFSRDACWWTVHVRALDLHIQARCSHEIEHMAREVIAVSTGREVADVEVCVRML